MKYSLHFIYSSSDDDILKRICNLLKIRNDLVENDDRRILNISENTHTR